MLIKSFLAINAFRMWPFCSSGCGAFVFVTLLVLAIMGIVFIFVHDKTAHIVYASIGALCFSFYMVYDTQVRILLLAQSRKSSILTAR